MAMVRARLQYGKWMVEEVVQLMSLIKPNTKTPVRALKGFKRYF
jgi:hypothetical protein